MSTGSRRWREPESAATESMPVTEPQCAAPTLQLGERPAVLLPVDNGEHDAAKATPLGRECCQRKPAAVPTYARLSALILVPAILDV
jgi:hypothetical protein